MAGSRVSFATALFASPLTQRRITHRGVEASDGAQVGREGRPVEAEEEVDALGLVASSSSKKIARQSPSSSIAVFSATHLPGCAMKRYCRRSEAWKRSATSSAPLRDPARFRRRSDGDGLASRFAADAATDGFRHSRR